MEFKEYLLNELYAIAQENGIENQINVAEYRSFKMPDNKEDLLFVIKPITGGYVGGIKTQPLQIFCYSQLNDMQSAYLLLDTFAKKHSQFQMTEDTTFIKMNFDTPVSMRNFIQSEEGYRASVYCFGTIIICEDVSDIKELYVELAQGEYTKIDFLSAQLSYIAVLNTTKYSGQQISVSMKQEAGLTFTLSLMNTSSAFCNKVRSISLGQISGNFAFEFYFTYTDETVSGWDDFHHLTMKLESSTLPSSKTAAPALTLTFRK